MASLAALDLPAARADVAARRHALPLLGVAAQVGLALLVVQAYQLETRTFFVVALLAAAGFLPHALLPARLRLPAFALLSAAGVLLVVGLADTLWLLGTGVALVGLCHLPVRVGVRIGLLVAAAAVLAAARLGAIPTPWSAGLWAVLGSIFMFRLALYLHALQHEPVRPTPTQAAAYFLMLPNPVFPLFPVVDFTTFVKRHYSDDALETYQTGAMWIARGLVHLLLYRIVYQFLPADPLQLASLRDLVWYLLGTFLLYLRVSGQFHLIIGVLHLYGFALPETHRLFFLASSFTDFWRRINIYWKDFMMKLVYYPSFFRLRRLGGTVALVGATVLVFVVTWLLHSYQWFWILGTFPLTLPDLLFWSILGALVVVTSVREAKRGRDRSLGASRWSARLAARVVATFCVLCVLWSLWSAESLVEWLWMWRAGARVDAAGVALVVALLLVGGAIAGRNWSAPRLGTGAALPVWRRPGVRTSATLLALLALAQPAVAERLGPATPLALAARRTTLNAADAAVERRGYYERLDHAPRLGARGWEAGARRPADWQGLPTTAAYRPRRDFLLFDLRPNAQVTYLRRPLTINAWGMRDAPRTLDAAPGTVRFAFLGPSYVMGTGVGDDETFTAQLERRLNASAPAGTRYEMLNFGAPAHSVLQQRATLDQQALRFAPQVVVVAVHAEVSSQLVSHLAMVVKQRIPIPYPEVDSLLKAWHVSPRLPWRELIGILRVVAPEIHALTLRRIAEECRRLGIVPVVVALDLPGAPQTPESLVPLRVAEREGFEVIDIFDVYGPPERHAALRIAPWDAHPTAAGHALIAERLLAELRRRPALLAPRPPLAAGETSPSQ